VLFDLVFVEIISLTRLGVLRGVFLANHLASSDNLVNITNKQKAKLQQYNEKTFYGKMSA